MRSAQHDRKRLTLGPYVGFFLERLYGPSALASKIMYRNLLVEEGHWGYFADTHSAVHQALAPGRGLDERIESMLLSQMDDVQRLLAGQTELDVDLYTFAERLITNTSTNAVYGDENPFKAVVVRKTFWYALSRPDRLGQEAD